MDPQNAREFRDSYAPTSDMLYAQINWGNFGALFYIPLEVQQEAFHFLGSQKYIQLPGLGTNPRGVEISSNAFKRILKSRETYKIDINWKKSDVSYNPYKRWIELWEGD